MGYSADNKIRAVIFDLGGVIVRTMDFGPRKQLAEQYGMTLNGLMDLFFGNESGKRAQLGEITYEEQWEYLGEVLGLSAEELQSFQDIFWSKDCVDYELVEALRSLHGKYHTALLSNAFSNLRQWVTEREKFADVFDEMIISAEVGVMKPDPRIYRLTLERLGVQAEQAVFVDDMPHNVEAAQALGMHAIQYKDTPQVLGNLHALLNGD